jgi:hypothetical protein
MLAKFVSEILRERTSLETYLDDNMESILDSLYGCVAYFKMI